MELVIEDDESAPATLERVLPQVAARADVLLGPYSTQLARAAGRIAADHDWLVWNHGGSGDDVETAHPGHMVSILTPTSRYADPFLRHLADIGDSGQLWLVRSRGSFGRQVTSGAALADHCARATGSTDRVDLWAAAAALDTTTLFGDFGIDPATGAQHKHTTALLQWDHNRPQLRD